MKIDPESGQRLDREGDEGEEGGLAVEVAAHEAPRAARLQEVVCDVLSGVLPRARALKPWEPPALRPNHIQMCFDKAEGGLNQNEIAEKYGTTPGRVSTILRHPDAEFLIGEILGLTADRIADPIERMKSFSHEMINKKLTLVRDPATPRTLQNDIASDFLDRAGYGARKKVDVDTTHKLSIPAAAAARLTSVLEESMRVESAPVDYTRYLAPKLQEDGSAGASPAAASGTGHTEALDETSLIAPPATPTDEVREAERVANEEWDRKPALRVHRRSA